MLDGEVVYEQKIIEVEMNVYDLWRSAHWLLNYANAEMITKNRKDILAAISLLVSVLEKGEKANG